MAYRSRTNWAAVILAVLFIGAVVFLGVVTEGFKNWDTSTWFKKDEEAPLPPVEGSGVTDIDGNELDGATVHALPERMVFYSPSALSSTAQDGISLIAIITPDDADNQLVDWAVVWVETQSGTVTDYVTVTPDSDGSLTAKVKCLQPFDKKIKVVVTSRDNPEAKIECVLDYAQRLTDISLNLETKTGGTVKATTGADGSISMTWVYDVNTYSYVVPKEKSPKYSKYTVTDMFSFTYKYRGTQDFVTAVSAAGFETDSNATTAQVISSSGMPWEWEFPSIVMSDTGYVMYTATNGGANSIARELKKLSGDVVLAYIDVTATGVYSTFTKSIPIKVSQSALKIGVESVSLGQDSVVL